MTRIVVRTGVVACAVAVAACAWTQIGSAAAAPPRAAAASAVSSAPPSQPPRPSVAGKPRAADEDLTAFATGALVVREPEPDSVASASWLLRGPHETEQVWGASGPPSRWVVVIELPEQSVVGRLEFDTVMVTGGSAKDVLVEMSDTGPTAGFEPLASVLLKDRVDDQAFPVAAQTPGRWIRLTVRSSHGADYVGIGRFRARGTRLTTTPFPNVSGTYQTHNGSMHIRQEGTSIVGCYDDRGGVVQGGIDGRVMTLTWREQVEEQNEGSAFMVFSRDGQRWAGLFSYKGEDPNVGRFWTGTKQSAEPGSCPHWSGGIEQRLAAEIEQFGRVRVYGINFNSDSDHLRDESQTILDRVAAVLKARPQWTIAVEGHTDASGAAAHNQDLSSRRAGAVRHYLVGAGIDAARLTAAGFGATRPVAPNETAIGRAQNRRVELVKQ